MDMYNAMTDVPGIKVGHFTDKKAATGCTVVLCELGVLARPIGRASTRRKVWLACRHLGM